eukprot:TRINITY_DN2018_c0_g1_i2.p2 TRINITY_DN2018_c0_g1~~TRINITY_DN2018_c0_g1_i2.p2  ORF type:complete len:222 (-),score=45.41 TRINITY_DN2018_c0_g1_i2:18-683(-)
MTSNFPGMLKDAQGALTATFARQDVAEWNSKLTAELNEAKGKTCTSQELEKAHEADARRKKYEKLRSKQGDLGKHLDASGRRCVSRWQRSKHFLAEAAVATWNWFDKLPADLKEAVKLSIKVIWDGVGCFFKFVGLCTSVAEAATWKLLRELNEVNGTGFAKTCFRIVQTWGFSSSTLLDKGKAIFRLFSEFYTIFPIGKIFTAIKESMEWCAPYCPPALH